MKLKLLFSLTTVCCICSASAQSVIEMWNKTFASTVQNAAAISFSVTCDGISGGDAFNLDTVCHVLSSADAMWHSNGNRQKHLWITQDTFCFFNQMADDIVYGSTWKDSTRTEPSQLFNMLIFPQKVAWGWLAEYIPLYFTRWGYTPDKYAPESFCDTILSDTSYRVFLAVDHSIGVMDGDRFVPNDDSIHFYLNQETKLVDRIDASSRNAFRGEDSYQYVRYFFHDLRVLDTVPALGDEWNAASPVYQNTPKYDIRHFVPASLANMRPETRYRVTDREILNYPLINIAGDTVTIGQMTGWLLLDFFNYGCKPCVRFHASILEESRADGLCRLEQNGVKVVCILPKTGLSDTFRRYVEKYGLQERAYCAREMGPSVNGLDYYPKYYLISPDKKIVIEDVNDLPVILNAINEYEKSN